MFSLLAVLQVLQLLISSTVANIMVGSITITEDGQQVKRYVSSEYPPAITLSGNSLSLTHNSQVQIAETYSESWDPNMFKKYKLQGKTLSFTTDISEIGCSCNAALYTVSMPGIGSNGQASGGERGTYYCDANHVQKQWCWEMDIMEANKYTTVATPHKCYQAPGGYISSCDQGGCGTNAYHVNSKGMGPGSSYTIDTRYPFRYSLYYGDTYHVTLSQNGKTFEFDACDDASYRATMNQMFEFGQVIIISHWGDAYSKMDWLDSMTGCSGDCDTSGNFKVSDIEISSGNTAGGSGSGSTGSGSTDTGSSSDCGYVPSTCTGDLNWAASTGKSQYPQYYSNFQSVTGVALSSASTEDMQLYWACKNYNPNGHCSGLQKPCSRTCYPSSSGSGSTGSSGSGSSGSSGSITITQTASANQWWYAVTVSASSGLTVNSLKMKGSGMWSWETGVYEWGYYKFNGNAPYSAPLSFQATLSSGTVVEGQVISSMSSGASGTLSVSSAFTAEEETVSTTDGLSTGGVVAIVVSMVLVCGMMAALCFVCHRRKNKVIAAGVEDEEVIGDNAIVDDMEKETGYDMTPIGDGDGQTGNTGDNEQEVMIEVPVTETNQ